MRAIYASRAEPPPCAGNGLRGMRTCDRFSDLGHDVMHSVFRILQSIGEVHARHETRRQSSLGRPSVIYEAHALPHLSKNVRSCSFVLHDVPECLAQCDALAAPHGRCEAGRGSGAETSSSRWLSR
jgi:hypothetical protein